MRASGGADGRSSTEEAFWADERSSAAEVSWTDERSSAEEAFWADGRSSAEEVSWTDERSSAAEASGLDGQKEAEESVLLDEFTDYIDAAEIEEALSELIDSEKFSFLDTMKSLLTGSIPFNWDSLTEIVSELFLGEWKRQRTLAGQILLIALASAIFSNFIRVFDNHQISDISFYMMYLMLSTLLMNAFSSLADQVSTTCEAWITFMKILLPSYAITIVLSAGTITALGFYEITLFAIGLLQALIIKVILPAVHFYMLVLVLNQITTEDYFSRTAQLLETLISWGTKSVLGLVVGLQAVQRMIAPAVDSMKNSTLNRVVSIIPGIGSAWDAAAQTVAGAAVVIKNAAGVAGIFALGMIGLTPFVRLAACVLLFRILCAAIAPVCDRRMVDGIESISKGSVLLLRVMASALAIFVISIAMTCP
ncbi:MAG: stage III sporulation protein AE [Lachnospiraceae bacterium]|nr:stage III sporulation protein AE [Lachnospiraceae bacterium]